MDSSTQRIGPLQKKLAKAAPRSQDKSYTRHLLWAGYLSYLIVNDIFMTVQAFKLANFVRFNTSLSIIHNWSIWLDLQLLWRTIPVVLKAHGAY